MDLASNFQQRVFDAFPAYPHFVTIYSIREKFPEYDAETIRKAIARLVGLNRVERKEVSRRDVLYRVKKGAQRPVEMRGHHGKAGRPACQ